MPIAVSRHATCEPIFRIFNIIFIYFIILYLFHPPPDTKKVLPATHRSHAPRRRQRIELGPNIVVVVIIVVDLYRLRTGERVFFNNTYIAYLQRFFYMQYELHVAHHHDVSRSVRTLKIVHSANRKKNHIYYNIIITPVISRRGVW